MNNIKKSKNKEKINQNYKVLLEEIENKNKIILQLNIETTSLSRLDMLEDSFVSVLEKIKKLRKRVDIEKQKELDNKRNLILQNIQDIRFMYVDVAITMCDCDIDKEYLYSTVRNLSIYKKAKTYVLRYIIEKIVPVHPKDEYSLTRQLKRHFIIHCGTTNTGKTYTALEALKQSNKGIYLGPLRLLALEVFNKLNNEGYACSLSTGEENILVEDSKFTSSTVEKLNIKESYDCAVIDEAQLVSDSQRGHAWTRAILGVNAKNVHICCSPDAVQLITDLINSCGDSYEENFCERDTDLIFEKKIQFIFPNGVQDGDALIVFSKRMVLSVANVLFEIGIKASVIYGALPPEARRKQVEMFLSGETTVVVATDAIGMGLNLPIKRVVFLETLKFNGAYVDRISIPQIKQIAGRAGRKGIYNPGYVNTYDRKQLIEKGLKSELELLTHSFYLPEKEYILTLPFGTLEERLQGVLRVRNKLNNFPRTDISEQLKLLFQLNEMKSKNKELKNISMEEDYRLIFIPFDTKNEVLLSQWKSHIKDYVLQKTPKVPENFSKTLDSYELFYKKLDLYYAFCMSMKIKIDIDEVRNLKENTSDLIHHLLKDNIKIMGKRCNSCNKKLPWNYQHGLCTECFERRYFNFYWDNDYY